jgi:uncharacterized membrane protein YhaH (DUF805 family)
MGEYLAIFRSFDGRIPRSQFWPGVIGIVIAQIAVGLLMTSLFTIYFKAVNPQEPAEVIATVRPWAWATFAANIVFAYPILALAVKRRHDRNSSGIDVRVYYALLLLLNLAQAIGLGYVDTQMLDGTVFPTPGPVLNAISAIYGLLGLYLLVVLGFLRGTRGPNSYGPDPLGGGA